MNIEEKTFAIIKPEAVAAKNIGKIIQLIEDAGFSIICMKLMVISEDLARKFYLIHSKKPWFDELIFYMISGPIVAMALQKKDAVFAWRELMGATDPKNAAIGTIRQLFGSSISQNAVHGSDSVENAKIELSLFFGSEIF